MYQFDLATLEVGRTIERALNEGKSITVALGGKLTEAPKREFRSAKPYVRTKMRIPESGVW